MFEGLFLPCGLNYFESPSTRPVLRQVRGDSCPKLPDSFFQTGPYAELSAVCQLMAVFPNFTHNILDLLTIRNATTPVAIPLRSNLRILQIEIIIGVAGRGCGERLKMIFKHGFYWKHQMRWG